ncbi:MAG: ribonuclease III [Rhodobiaceae bacterium]|nr:ribonuclease III [Rhodobiaceae bacterium]
MDRQSKQQWCKSTLGYDFNDNSLLDLALTHRSHSKDNNERLEFLGDAVLDLILSDTLYRGYSLMDEGNLSRMRASIVNEKSLSLVASQLLINEHLILGPGEMTSGGSQRDSILANTLEAILGAVFVDGGYDSVENIILKIFKDNINSIDPESDYKDSKSQLQELLQQQQKDLPQYQLIETTGDKHDQEFLIECVIDNGNIITTATAKNIKTAEQKAASKALKKLIND